MVDVKLLEMLLSLDWW